MMKNFLVYKPIKPADASGNFQIHLMSGLILELNIQEVELLLKNLKKLQ